MKIKKTILSLVLAIATITMCTTAVWAEGINAFAPAAANGARGIVSLPTGTYYCLSTGRGDSYIKINDNQTVSYNNVYSREEKAYVTGTGTHTYSLNSDFNFCITSWHIVGSTTNQTGTLIIPTKYSGGDFILVNGEIYAIKK